MMDMERDQSQVTDTAFQIELAGRRFGKTTQTRRVQAQDVDPAALGKAREHRRQRKALKLWGRRYETTNEGRGQRPAAPPVRCPHVEQRWAVQPHPRYGMAHPIYQPYLASVTTEHSCVPGVRR